ncbi:hypothetical protein NEIG_01026 [Nematocida sp. ERTm5]|nr:hypothetical protein NEIRO02_0744 [Nematocida sp. AWRm79]KAI5183176.1 hypothetical protein NEIRO03_0794 [Nematocida sp. AWRm78]OAG33276.1 hypothetical protein NEIG_01026 [Nematocida sp. ERTm5]
MFERFTIRTKPYETSQFQSDKHFSVMKMLSLDPIGALAADEFTAWIILTLLLCFIFYLYSILKKAAKKRIFGPKRTGIAKEDVSNNIDDTE